VKTNRRLPLALACFLMMIFAAGCAAVSPVTATRETLEERVKQYMQAQIDGKWDTVYSCFDDSSRAKLTRESFVKGSRSLPYRGFAIQEITLLPSGDRATVKVGIDFRIRGYDFTGPFQLQEWIAERGEWFVKYEPPQGKNPFTPQEKQQ
jgi:hypothetical protein